MERRRNRGLGVGKGGKEVAFLRGIFVEDGRLA